MMAPQSEITITTDMLRRRLVDMVPFCLRDVAGLVATALLGAAMVSWALSLAAQILEAPQ